MWFLTDSDNWVKTYTIPRALDTHWHMPLGMTHDGGRLLFHCSFYRRVEDVVRIYDPCTNTYKDVTRTPAISSSKRLSLCNLHLDSFITARI
jgi:hypothetical protein